MTTGNLNRKGRPKGTPNKTTGALKDAILVAGENVGRVDVETEITEKGRTITRRRGTGDAGLIGYLEGLALDEPVAFAGLLGKVLPLTLAADPKNPPKFVLTWDTSAPAANPKVAEPDA